MSKSIIYFKCDGKIAYTLSVATVQFYRRGSDVTDQQTPSKMRVRVDEDGNVTNDNLTWAQAQRLVEVDDYQTNKIYRLSIFEVINLIIY